MVACFSAALLCGLVGCQRSLPPDVRADDGAVARLREILDEGKSAAAGASTEAAEPTGFATIKGKIVLKGTPPSYNLPKIDKDESVCAGPHVRSETVDIEGGGLKNVLLFVNSNIPDDPKWIHESYDAAKTAEVEFDQKKCVFLSHVFAFRASQKVKILNSDPVGHNTNIAGSAKIPAFNQIIPANSSVLYDAKNVASPQPADVSCSIHPWMSSYVFTRNHPYFAVTSPDGTFEIANIPAGVPLEIRVWHEAFKFIGTVGMNGAALKTPKGTIKQTLNPGDTVEWNLEFDATLLSK
jgi:hypothetical protein